MVRWSRVGGGGGWAARGGWAAGGRLYLPIGLFGVAMGPRSAIVIGPESLRDVSLTHRYPCTFHLVPSMGPIASVVTLHGRQNPL